MAHAQKRQRTRRDGTPGAVVWCLRYINPETGKAFMHVDECWYCGPCAARCPTGAVTVNMPFLLR